MLIEECQQQAGTTPNSVPTTSPNATPPAIGIHPAHYSGPATDPQIEALTRRAYTRRRSRLVDRWIQYADAEGFTGCGREVQA